MTEASESAPRVSAVIVSYFTGPLLARAIASLMAQPGIAEIIIVDNGNWEGAVDAAIAANAGGALVDVITGHGNVGFAAGCNLGAAKASSDFLLLLNPDAVLPSGGIARLIADGAALERPWVQGAKIVDPDGAEQQGSRRMTLTPWRAFVETTKLYALAPRHPYFRRFNLHTDPCPEEVAPIPVVSGACLFIPREDYFSIGGMDENYFLHVEDVDFCLRFAEAGGGVYFNPHVRVPHFKSSSRVDPIRVEARKTSSVIRYFNRHFSEPYPAPFLWLVAGALWLMLGVKTAQRALARTVALGGLIFRRGSGFARRAREIKARRSSR